MKFFVGVLLGALLGVLNVCFFHKSEEAVIKGFVITLLAIAVGGILGGY
jgi:VIT1/CCC1 family predicted Fe2+/Mn2+ transporter